MRKNVAMMMVVIAILFGTSCKKPLVTTIEGKVVNYGSKQPIDSVKVYFRDGWANGGSSSATPDYTYTDANGHFKISTEAGTPFLYLSKQGYEFVVQSYGSSDNTKYFAPGSYYNNVVLDLQAMAYFHGVFKGQSSLLSDSVYFDSASQRYATQQISLNVLRQRNQWNFGNGPFKMPFAIHEIGDVYFSYWIEYQIHGVWHEKIDSVYIKSFTTYKDTIYF